MFPRESYIQVDVPTLAAAGRAIDQVSTELENVHASAGGAAYRVLGAIPPSDLFESFAFCWGRWSAVLDNATQSVRHTGAAVAQGADVFHRSDQAAATAFPGGS